MSAEAIIETSGSETYLRFERAGDGAHGGGEIPQHERPEENVAVWTLYGGGTYECEVWVAPELEGGFSAFAAHLPGVVAQGDDIDRAVYEIQRALSAALASYIERGEHIPWTDEPITIDTENPVTKRWILVNG